MIILIIGVAAFLATLFGGLFALKHRDKLHLITGFSAGAIIGAAFFDLLPEAFELSSEAHSFGWLALFLGGGFFLYMILDRTLSLPDHHAHQVSNPDHSIRRGIVGASSLSFHSFLDGLMVGLSFQVSTAVGLVVTAAVLTHDFSDGINTVTLILKNGGTRKEAFRWLLVDAGAPLLGILMGFLFSVPSVALGGMLAAFCGCFLYIGASELLPESFHAHPKKLTTFMTLLGAAVIYLAVSLAH